MMTQTLRVESHLTRLRTSVVAMKPVEGTKVTFDLQADVKAVARNGARVKLRFAIGIETFPLIYRAEMGGFAFASLDTLAMDEGLEDLGEGVLSDIILQVFRSNYEPLYLALSTMGVSAPSPWLVQDVHLKN